MASLGMTGGRKLAIVWLLLLGSLRAPLGDLVGVIVIIALLCGAGYVSPFSRARTASIMTIAGVGMTIVDAIVGSGAFLVWQNRPVWQAIGVTVWIYAVMWLSALIAVSLGSGIARRKRLHSE